MSYHIISSRVCLSDLSSNPFFFAFPRFDIRELKLEDVNGASWSHRVAGGASSNLLGFNKRGLVVNPFFLEPTKKFGWFCWVELLFSEIDFVFSKGFLQDKQTKSCVQNAFFCPETRTRCHESKKPFRFFGNGPKEAGIRLVRQQDRWILEENPSVEGGEVFQMRGVFKP